MGAPVGEREWTDADLAALIYDTPHGYALMLQDDHIRTVYFRRLRESGAHLSASARQRPPRKRMKENPMRYVKSILAAALTISVMSVGAPAQADTTSTETTTTTTVAPALTPEEIAAAKKAAVDVATAKKAESGPAVRGYLLWALGPVIIAWFYSRLLLPVRE